MDEDKRQKDRAKRLWRNYRWTLDMYNALGEAQGWRCGACGREAIPGGMPLNLDHEHFVVNTELTGSPAKHQKWRAKIVLKDGRDFVAYAPTKALAVAQVKDKALPHSVRGLLCPGRYRGCNRLLGRIDDIHLLESFLAYLKNPPAKQIVLDKSA